MSEWQSYKEQVLAACQQMGRLGLVVGTEGNVSARVRGAELLVVTPSGRPYDTLSADDILVTDFTGDPVEGELIPSVETLTHVAVYEARLDVGAVVHTHSPYATAAAAARVSLPAMLDEQTIRLGGEVKVSRYAMAASEDLAEAAVAALGDRAAALLANHVVLAVGADPAGALLVAQLVERLAQIYLLAASIGGPAPLPPEVVAAQKEIYAMMKEAKE